MIEQIVSVFVWGIILSGLFFIVVGAIGILRMPDVYSRLHAAGMTDTMGAGLLLVGLAVNEGLTLIAMRLVLIWIFLLFTSPVGTHALARAAIQAGVVPIQGKEVEP